MPVELKSLNEECGVFGIWGHPEAAQLTYFGLHALQHRGQEGAGILSNNDGQLQRHRDLGLVTEVFRHEKDLQKLSGKAAMGHVRYATAGSAELNNIQPFHFKFQDTQLGLAHNGNLTNAVSLRRELEAQGAIFSSSSDTEILAHLIRRSHHPEFMGKVKEALNTVKGGFAYLLMTEDSMIAALDPYGFRPLSIGKMANGALVVASETCAFDLIEAEFIRDVKPGEMLIFTQGNDKFESIELFSQTPRICAFEYIYFARPDSIVEGKSVYEVRKKMGEALAKKFAYKADFVVPVPDSGVSAAIGFAQYLQIPLEMAIVRNHYVGRTFIEPTQELRNLKVKLKLNPMRKVLEGKEIVVIDDSLVRGTTSKKIISLLRAAGASKIHLAIACPEIKFPDTYGIDTPTFEELISANKNAEEVREYVEADTLSFLSIEELTQSIGDERKYSLISFDGDYFIK